MAGKIVADTLEHSTAGSIATNYVVEGSAKAWVNINGVSGTPVARDSLSLSSLVDNGTGVYQVNLSNAMSAADYAICMGGNYVLSGFVFNASAPCNTYTTSRFEFECWNTVFDTRLDYEYVSGEINGDLA